MSIVDDIDTVQAFVNWDITNSKAIEAWKKIRDHLKAGMLKDECLCEIKFCYKCGKDVRHVKQSNESE